MNRIDTKYLIRRDVLYKLLWEMKDRYYVQEINGHRVSLYHTTYLDTENIAMYLAHQSGRRPREKIRLRSYIDTGQTFLEIKDKNNKGRTRKTRIPIEDINQLQTADVQGFITEKSHFSPGDIFPRLKNSFYRITLVNVEMTERLTIDLDIRFLNVYTQQACKIEELVIVELKQDGNYTSYAKKILSQHQIRPASISKYCLGSILTDDTIKYNRFKKKIRYINKLINT
ncbi:polyphosphate polymerase domain-containing protein [Parabacteroides sp. PF5-9]|uniref:polyphosphate polymerase domain-containing protein n=1 Tax=Parabacteroides sp. PF5-9 TaxID=1742404 RepID=UPI002474DC47|nr:polyphosphate polymerase domain-containing protein [Parabacteroides sp. PF5-9]MDH6358346.1 hypothetical protein [Parabacteroides sp. PF5-9]